PPPSLHPSLVPRHAYCPAASSSWDSFHPPTPRPACRIPGTALNQCSYASEDSPANSPRNEERCYKPNWVIYSVRPSNKRAPRPLLLFRLPFCRFPPEEALHNGAAIDARRPVLLLRPFLSAR